MEDAANLGGIQTIGLVNSLKTGNVAIDMALAMLLPILLGSMLGGFKALHTFLVEVDWMKYFRDETEHYSRTIKHSTVTSVYSTRDLDGDSQNEILIKAIQLYLDHEDLLELRAAELELRQVGEDKTRNSYYYYGNDNSTSLADTLGKYKVTKKPFPNVWLTIGNFGHDDDNQHAVTLFIEDKREDVKSEGDGPSSTRRRELSFHFRSTGKDSIDMFIDQAYTWYVEQLKSLEDDSRYMYELKKKSSGDDDGESSFSYKRYQLSDEKTFESLFFKEKENVLNVVDHFTNKTGKYAIKGYPNKLGLMLHGPPGTGKTSLIKALAQYTGRSIVNVPLARISTNAELASLFFDQKYSVDGESLPVKLGFKDVIFVMEDVDAVSKVVRRRDGKTTGELTYTENVNMPVTKSLWRMILESNNSDCQEITKLLIEKSKRLKEASKDPNMICSTVKRMTALPGLSLVGENVESSEHHETKAKILADSIEKANEMMNNQTSVDSFIGANAKTIKQMLENGVEINEEFENELLGVTTSGDSVSGSFFSLRKPSVSRQVSYQKNLKNEDFVREDSPSRKKTENDDMVEIGPSMMEGFGSTSNISSSTKGIGNGAMASWKAKRDDLNLSGLLNVLDGVVDTPGRMLIMTSNHPELLDPALIRPGRIDKKLLLSYLTHVDLVKMIQHYFQVDLNNNEVERVKKAINQPPTLKFTPAQIEQMACEHDTVESLIAHMEQMKEVQLTNIYTDQIVWG